MILYAPIIFPYYMLSYKLCVCREGQRVAVMVNLLSQTFESSNKSIMFRFPLCFSISDSCQFTDMITLSKHHKHCISIFRKYPVNAAVSPSGINYCILKLEVYLFVGTEAASGRVLIGV